MPATLRRFSPFALIALAFGVCAFYTLRFHHRMPLFEHQLLAPLLERMKNGERIGLLEPGELVIGGGHWYLTGNTLGLWLAHVSHWNLRWDAMAIMLVLLSACALLFAHIRALEGTVQAKYWLAAAGCAVILSLNQGVNLLWTNQISQFIYVALAIGCAALISRPRLTPPVQLALMLLSAACIYTLANGLALMATIVLIQFFRREPWPWRLTWLALFTACTAHYLIAFKAHALADHPVLHATRLDASTPFQLALYVLNAMGTSVVRLMEQLAPVWGIIGLALLGVFLWRCFTLRRNDPRWLGGMLLAASALGYAAIGSVGRYAFGAAQGLNPRNITQMNLFWLGLLLLAYHLYPALPRRWKKGLWVFALLSALLCLANSIQIARKEVRVGERYERIISHLETQWQTIDPEVLEPISYNGVDAQKERLSHMKALGYNIFYNGE